MEVGGMPASMSPVARGLHVLWPFESRQRQKAIFKRSQGKFEAVNRHASRLS